MTNETRTNLFFIKYTGSVFAATSLKFTLHVSLIMNAHNRGSHITSYFDSIIIINRIIIMSL